MSDEPRLLLDASHLREELEQEVLAMSFYLCGSGRPLPPALVSTLRLLDASERPPIETLVDAHTALCEQVHPAQPRTLALLSRRGVFSDQGSTFSAVPIIRRMMVVAVSSLFGAVFVGMSPDISGDPSVGNPLTASGIPLLVNQVYFMLTAALGAAFYAITTLNRQITEGIYDPRDDAAHWTRIVLGVISGTILSSLIEVPDGSNLHQVGRNALALLGGFSAGLVHRILHRMVSSVESIFGADSPDASTRPLDTVRTSRFASLERDRETGLLGTSRLGSIATGAAQDASAPAPAPAPEPDPAPKPEQSPPPVATA